MSGTAQVQGVGHVLESLEGGDELEPPGLEILLVEHALTNEAPLTGRRCGYRRGRRLDADDVPNARIEELGQEGTVTRADVNGRGVWWQRANEVAEQVRVGRTGVPGLLGARVVGVTVQRGQRIRRGSRRGVQELAGGALDQAVMHVLGQLPGCEGKATVAWPPFGLSAGSDPGATRASSPTTPDPSRAQPSLPSLSRAWFRLCSCWPSAAPPRGHAA